MVSPAMVGSMAIKGVFKAAGLLTGLGSTINKLKKTQMTSKSTTTEMKRMTNQTHLLRKALAMIGVAGFTNLLMQTPQLAGSLAKIKNELTQLAISIPQRSDLNHLNSLMILRVTQNFNPATV